MRTLGLALIGTIAAGVVAVPIDGAKAETPYAPMWTGFYAGIHAGYGWGETESTTFNNVGAQVNTGASEPEGPFVGGQVGYNVRVAPAVLLGVEADFSGGGIEGGAGGCNLVGFCSEVDGHVDFLGTVRARLGFVQGNWLVYATGGVAFAHAEAERTINAVGMSGANPALIGRSASDSGWENGWVVGGGVEWALLPGYSIKLEYQRLQFDDVTREFEYPPFAGQFRRMETELTIDTVRVGLNARLN